MSEIEIITNGGRRRYWPAEMKVRIVEETLGGESISSVARRNGVAPNLLYRWRRLMLEGETTMASYSRIITRSASFTADTSVNIWRVNCMFSGAANLWL